jgi:FkbM family methyltransferase
LPAVFTLSGDLAARHLAQHGSYEEETGQLIDFLQQPDGSDGQRRFADVLIDIGANIGLISIQNHKKFTRVFAFEPNPIASNVMRSNLLLAGARNVDLFEVGLGPTAGRYELEIPPGNLGAAFIREGNRYEHEFLRNRAVEREVEIELVSSDFFVQHVLEKIDGDTHASGVIKVDTEGYELAILETILPVLTDRDFAVIFEMNNAASIDEVESRLSAAGWNGAGIYEYLPSTHRGLTGRLGAALEIAVHGRRHLLFERRGHDVTSPPSHLVLTPIAL